MRVMRSKVVIVVGLLLLGLFVPMVVTGAWNAEAGPPADISVAAWSLSATFKGYPALAVSPEVRTFQGYGMGSYSYFNQGQPIEAATAFQVPQTPGVRMHDLLSVLLDGSCSIASVINGTGAVVAKPQQSAPSQVVSYP